MSSFEKLLSTNKLAAAAHFVSLIGIIVAYRKWNTYNGTQLYRNKLPSTAQLANPLANSTGSTGTPPATESEGQCRVNWAQGPPAKTVKYNQIYAVILFFAISAGAHFFYATSTAYATVIAQGWNPYRWVEYALSASLMAVVIGSNLGVHDSPTLAIFALITAAMQGCGYITESALRMSKLNKEVVLGATTVGWLLLLALWGPLIYSFANIIKDLKQYETAQNKLKIPNFVYFILAIQAINFCCFGFIQLHQVRAALSGSPQKYIDVEASYIKLSFVGKLALASGLGYGLLFRLKDCPKPTADTSGNTAT